VEQIQVLLNKDYQVDQAVADQVLHLHQEEQVILLQ
jgi:hypothetical protein